jgi:hypothetical protein
MVQEIDAAVHRQLGELIAGMRGLQESVKRVEDQALRSEDKSAESRAVVHRRMDEISTRVGSVEASIASVKEDVIEMKPITDDVRRWRMMGIGALGVVGIGGAVLGVSFGDVVKRIFSLLTGGKIG